jgi:hypothetical protein
MRRTLALFLIICPLAVAETTGVQLDIKSLTPRDKNLDSSSKSLCEQMGTESCADIKNICKDNPLPNSCFLRSFLFLAMDIQVCGEKNLGICAKERDEYAQKISDFADNYASTPGLGRAALNSCAPFFKIEPEGEFLSGIQRDLNTVMPEIGVYMSNREYYNCVKDQYLKMTRE